MTKMKRPSVSSVAGSVSRMRSGRISVLMSPSASAAISAAVNVSTFDAREDVGEREQRQRVDEPDEDETHRSILHVAYGVRRAAPAL